MASLIEQSDKRIVPETKRSLTWRMRLIVLFVLVLFAVCVAIWISDWNLGYKAPLIMLLMFSTGFSLIGLRGVAHRYGICDDDSEDEVQTINRTIRGPGGTRI